MKKFEHKAKTALFGTMFVVLLLGMNTIPAHAGAPAGACGDMDLTFIVDTTSSMTGELANIKADLPLIIAEAQAASTSLRVGVISFDGSIINPYTGVLILQDFVDVKLPLSSVQADWTTAINSLTLGGGAGLPEASDQAKATAINLRTGSAAGISYPDANGNNGLVIADPILAPNGFNVPWAGDTNIAILITDDTSGGYDDTYSGGDSAFVQGLGTTAANNVPPIRMSDVFSGVDPNAITDLTADAVNSGGIFLQIAPDGMGTSSAIMDIVETCGSMDPIGGEILSISATSLLMGGVAANAMWIIPIIVGSVGTGFYFTRSHWNKSEE